MSATALQAFEALWTGETEPNLLVAALHLAHIAYPDLDLELQVARVDHLGELAAERVAGSPSEHTSLLRLCHLLFDEMGYRGDVLDYYDPRNSYLNDVLSRRTGIPISLSVLFLAVGARAGLAISGIGLPAHFVVRHEAHDPAHRVYVDPFNCQILPNRESCRRLISRLTEQEVQLPETAFLPLSTRQIIVRMLANLKGAYLRRGDLRHTIAVMDRLLLLLPEDAHQWRDRGLLHYQMDNYGQASFDLHRYLWLSDETEEQRAVVTDTLEAIEALRNRLN
jgi:regulator of sirC expression with transglutaminase-like and TPR domain